PGPFTLPLVHVLLVSHIAPPVRYTLSLHDALPISASRTVLTAALFGTEKFAHHMRPARVARRASSPTWKSSPPFAARNGKHEVRSEEHTSELQSRGHLVCRLLLEKEEHDRLGLAAA